MAIWEPGPDPFPAGEIDDIADFTYLDELAFVRHAEVHVHKPPESLWQLAADFRVSMTVVPSDGAAYPLTLLAPRGLCTDLSSVPQPFWSFLGPIGAHLEVSIVHDYLYMAWTDFREEDEVRRRDWDFADTLFRVGMKASGVGGIKRALAYRAVRMFGWPVFRAKSYTLANRMADWLPLLDAGHGRDG